MIMCGRYALIQTAKLSERFETENDLDDLRPNLNASPSQLMPVVTRNSPNRLKLMKWGLVPSWSKEPTVAYNTFNARDDHLTTSNTFKASFRHHRCLVPVSGYFEWKKVGNNKEPYYFKLKGKELFALAGLYNVWTDDKGNELPTFTIITTEPNAIAKEVHNRMPVILSKEDEEKWIEHIDQSDSELLEFLHPYLDEDMEFIPVNEKVSSLSRKWVGFGT